LLLDFFAFALFLDLTSFFATALDLTGFFATALDLTGFLALELNGEAELEPPPILNILVPQVPHVPSVANLPFFMVICLGLCMSLFALHFTQ
jgi:hypothetical protein